MFCCDDALSGLDPVEAPSTLKGMFCCDDALTGTLTYPGCVLFCGESWKLTYPSNCASLLGGGNCGAGILLGGNCGAGILSGGNCGAGILLGGNCGAGFLSGNGGGSLSRLYKNSINLDLSLNNSGCAYRFIRYSNKIKRFILCSLLCGWIGNNWLKLFINVL